PREVKCGPILHFTIGWTVSTKSVHSSGNLADALNFFRHADAIPTAANVLIGICAGFFPKVICEIFFPTVFSRRFVFAAKPYSTVIFPTLRCDRANDVPPSRCAALHAAAQERPVGLTARHVGFGFLFFPLHTAVSHFLLLGTERLILAGPSVILTQ